MNKIERLDYFDTTNAVAITIDKIVSTAKPLTITEQRAFSLLKQTNDYLTLLTARDDSLWSGDELDETTFLNKLDAQYPEYVRNQCIRDGIEAIHELSNSRNKYVRDLAGSIVRGDNWAAVRLYDAQIRSERF